MVGDGSMGVDSSDVSGSSADRGAAPRADGRAPPPRADGGAAPRADAHADPGADAREEGGVRVRVPSVLARFLTKCIKAIAVNQQGIESGHKQIKLMIGPKHLRAPTTVICNESLPKIARSHSRRIIKHLKPKGFAPSHLGDGPLDPDHIRIAHDIVTEASPGFLPAPSGTLEEAHDVSYFVINDGSVVKSTNMTAHRANQFISTFTGKKPARAPALDTKEGLPKLHVITHGCVLVTVIKTGSPEEQKRVPAQPKQASAQIDHVE